MKAMVATKYGDPEVLSAKEMPEPQVGDNDVLIRVQATAMNPVDTKARKHGLGGLLNPPLVLGFDVSGTIDKVGSAVKGFKPGEEVFAFLNLVRAGANAECVAADYRTIAHKPKKLSHTEAAAVPLVALTAWEAVHSRLALKKGEHILIQAAAGGVGHMALQFAKLAGAKVIATASSPESVKLCQKLGADTIINYREENVQERVAAITGGRGVECAFDCVGGTVFDTTLACLAARGRAATIVEGHNAPTNDLLFFKDASVHYVFIGSRFVHNMPVDDLGKELAEIAKLCDAGKLQAHIHKVVKLEQLVDAHKMQESGRVTGKIAVELN